MKLLIALLAGFLIFGCCGLTPETQTFSTTNTTVQAHAQVTECINGDNICPADCDALTDSDCQANSPGSTL